MILYKGEIYENLEQDRLISSLYEDMINTLSFGKHPSIDSVINACDRLYKRIMNHEFDEIALPLLKALNIPYSALDHYASYFSKEGLTKKVDI